MNKTDIEYLSHSWNPIAMRCTPISAGCQNCWHLNVNKRFSLHSGPPELREKELDAPLSKSMVPKMIGVQFMGDIFHESVPDEMIGRVFNSIYRYRHHTYLILTKRPARLYAQRTAYRSPDHWRESCFPNNLWVGVSVENQKTYDDRWEILKKIPASKVFISAEPFLCSIELRPWGRRPDWVVIGAETGPGARHMELDWAMDLKNQCKGAGIPFFFKKASKGDVVPTELMIREFPK
jgi:protein gp37